LSVPQTTLSFGQSETLTAVVSSGAGTPNDGTVMFMDGATTLGTSTVSNGTATLTPSTISVGLHYLKAIYSGDGTNFAGSTSASGIGSSSTIETAVGSAGQYFSGDGGPATDATLGSPTGVGLDAAGDLFVLDSFDTRIRVVNATTGIIIHQHCRRHWDLWL
jgi:hypothetical protein